MERVQRLIVTASREPVIEMRYRPDFRVDPWLTMAPLQHGRGDPTTRLLPSAIWRATRTPHGPATLRLTRDGADLAVLAWGPGSAWALAALPRLLGAEDEPERFQPRHPLLSHLQRRFRGLRFGRSDAVVEALLPAVLEQKVTGIEARTSYRAIIRTHGERAPGPGVLWISPLPGRLTATPTHAYHRLGVEERRAVTLRRIGALADRLEATTMLPGPEARARLQTLPGIGPWTAAEVGRVAFGDPDAVSIGDYHVPSLVSWALAGEPRGDDARMLELLEPYAGQRARVVRLLELAGDHPPRRGPRLAPRSIAGI
ncbi:MAG: DNA-3-methyladenine glycosylase 2 family protein [Chloroflexota bacterium]|nr:DNA-3-methyladenine glycosylase 2 family protein [Chloroflexota bacterium]